MEGQGPAEVLFLQRNQTPEFLQNKNLPHIKSPYNKPQKATKANYSLSTITETVLCR